jgi:hypothetical protein
LTLERADLAAVEGEISAQVDRVIQFSGRAIGLLQGLHFSILPARRSTIEEMLERTFDLSRAGIPTQSLVASERHLIEIEEVGSTLFEYRMRNERDLSLNDARLLRERSAPLITWAKDLLDHPAHEQGQSIAARHPAAA